MIDPLNMSPADVIHTLNHLRKTSADNFNRAHEHKRELIALRAKVETCTPDHVNSHGVEFISTNGGFTMIPRLSLLRQISEQIASGEARIAELATYVAALDKAIDAVRKQTDFPADCDRECYRTHYKAGANGLPYYSPVLHSPFCNKHPANAPVRCCERDNDGDGNCDVHAAPGVLRRRR